MHSLKVAAHDPIIRNYHMYQMIRPLKLGSNNFDMIHNANSNKRIIKCMSSRVQILSDPIVLFHNSQNVSF